MESIDEHIKRFLSFDYGYGCGYGRGYGGDDNDGFGSGNDYGDGNAFSNGYGYGSGSDYGSGSGHGSGSGYGSTNCGGDGYGYGNGSGDGIKAYNGQPVYAIDNMPTLIYTILGNYARGAILNDDLTLQPCYIAKVGNFFAHGETLKEARRDAEDKFLKGQPLEKRIDEFVEAHPELDVPYDDLFVWHNILTGSCEMGRKEWCKAHGYKPTDSITVREFINGAVGNYGGGIIQKLAEKYKIKTS